MLASQSEHFTYGGECVIRDLIFVETARVQFDALAKRHQADVSEALLRIIQEEHRSGVWRHADDRRLTVTYSVHPSGAIVVREISTAPAAPARPGQPYAGMEMRHEGGGRWIHMNPHEE
ncbi:hypothetical protein [Streptomyces swartbergensis]|uniref:Uncharacterized protein n=1 Tax=Streptomyces swartbergensis TaxID=487165 RepID=A0A243S5Q7_9ACTN|nr:hypothetical protein [Streptomyces swartbergensis]OUD02936.1 hypothetical protein CA983_12255 [Streptomyces swartbergensis]